MLFVAEIGLNHDGNPDIAHELIRSAKQSGAHIAKFQFGWRNKPDEIPLRPIRAEWSSTAPARTTALDAR